MTSWNAPDYTLEFETDTTTNTFAGDMLAVKIHRQDKTYPLNGMLSIQLSSLWLDSKKTKITLNQPVEIEIIACCDPMFTNEPQIATQTEKNDFIYKGKRIVGKRIVGKRIVGKRLPARIIAPVNHASTTSAVKGQNS